MKTNYFDIIVIGGGAAGYFVAIEAATLHRGASIAILERSGKVLQKVLISGGGRCNVTHACFNPKELINFYPRGGKELLGPFFKFNPTHTVDWFMNKGVLLKTEKDGRMFPQSDSSETIIDCFEKERKKLGIQLLLNQKVNSFSYENSTWVIKTPDIQYTAQALCLATGSNLAMWQKVSKLNHEIISPVPSLFTFNCKDQKINDLQGLSVPNAHIKINGHKLSAEGPLLITHWGFSGPAILKLSAWGARILNQIDYNFSIAINFTGIEIDEVTTKLAQFKNANPEKRIGSIALFSIPKRLWNSILLQYESRLWKSINPNEVKKMATILAQAEFQINGKSTFKEEFVTAGGVSLKEIDFRTMESKMQANLYFAGEILNIDAVTGGFNFQAAWTTAHIAAQNILKTI